MKSIQYRLDNLEDCIEKYNLNKYFENPVNSINFIKKYFQFFINDKQINKLFKKINRKLNICDKVNITCYLCLIVKYEFHIACLTTYYQCISAEDFNNIKFNDTGFLILYILGFEEYINTKNITNSWFVDNNARKKLLAKYINNLKMKSIIDRLDNLETYVKKHDFPKIDTRTIDFFKSLTQFLLDENLIGEIFKKMESGLNKIELKYEIYLCPYFKHIIFNTIHKPKYKNILLSSLLLVKWRYSYNNYSEYIMLYIFGFEEYIPNKIHGPWFKNNIERKKAFDEVYAKLKKEINND